MPFCAVFGCGNSNRKKDSQIKFHRFPKNEELQKKWLLVCRRKDKINVKTATICSVHFEEKYRKKTLQQTLLGYSPKNSRYLVDDAIPTQFLPTDTPENASSSSSVERKVRTEKRCRKRLVEQIVNNPPVSTNTSKKEEGEEEPIGVKDLIPETVDIGQLLERIKQLEEENQKLKLENERFKIERTDMERQKRELLDRVKTIPHVSDKQKLNLEIEKILSPLFSPGQIKSLLNKSKRPKWSKEDIASAISLRSVSPKAYRYLRNRLGYPLPDLSTLRRWALSLHIEQGFLDDVLTIMKTAAKSLSSKIENIVCLSYDEMKLDNKIEFDVRKEEVVGPCSSVQVMVARSIFGSWKQPIYYNFDSNMTKEIIVEAVARLNDAGYETVAIVSDMGGANVGVWKQLGVTTDKPFFINEATQNHIYVFADAPHMIKLLRNHYLDNGLTLENGHVVSKNCGEKLIELSTKSDLKLAHKITQANLDVRGPQRQRVKPAVQLFSNTTAMALKLCYEKQLIAKDGHDNTVSFFKHVNRWFDVLNSKMKFGEHEGVNAYGINETVQKTVLKTMTELMTTMRVGGKLTILPFQKGIIMSKTALKLLFEDLKSRYGIRYIRTIKLNSDVLENFFAYIRGMGSTNDHPTAYDFRYRLRWYLLGKHSQAVFTEKKNTDDCVNESNLSSLDQSQDQTKSSNEDKTMTKTLFASLKLEDATGDSSFTDNDNTFILDDLDADENEENTEEIISNEVLKYITGYVCHRFRNKYPHLGSTKNKDEEESKDNVDQLNWIHLLNRGSLIYPSEHFLQIAVSLEKIFQKLHGDYFKKGPNVLTDVYNSLLQEIVFDSKTFPKAVIMCWIRTRTFIRLKELNRQLKSGNKRAEAKKMKKIVS